MSACVPTATFAAVATISIDGISDAVAVDTNNDAATDIVSAGDGFLRVHISNGARSPTFASTIVGALDAGGTALGLAVRGPPSCLTLLACSNLWCGWCGLQDINGDGHVDIITCAVLTGGGELGCRQPARVASYLSLLLPQ